MHPYRLSDNDLLLEHFLDDAPRRYVLKIKDMPVEEKPREKLLKFGPSALTVVELIAVILNTGTKKEDVITMASRIVKEYGEKTFMNQSDPSKLSKELSIPLIKSLQIIACSELGRRFFQRKSGRPAIIRTAKDVHQYVRDIHDLPKEHLRGIYLDSHYRVIHDEVISIGTINSNLVHPREVFKPAIEYGASAIVLAHNHPSGVVKPSTADVEITRHLLAVSKIIGINLIDHVIVSREKFVSINIDYS